VATASRRFGAWTRRGGGGVRAFFGMAEEGSDSGSREVAANENVAASDFFADAP
jgi:hypothetical protein